MKIQNIIIGVAGFLIAIIIGWSLADVGDSQFGNVTVGNEYNATSTIHTAAIDSRLIREGWGQLGSVVVTGAGTSGFSLYNATSTDFSTNPKRATSTALLATIPASLAAGTYVFDLEYTDGLFIYYDVVGTAPTSTITFR